MRALAWLFVLGCKPPSPMLAPDASATLEAAVFAQQRLAVAAPADLVVPAHVGVTRDDVWGSEACRGEACVLALVQPPERVSLHLGDGDPEDRSFEVRALPPPTPTPFAPGTTLRSRLAPVSADDPRGPLADLAFSLDAPARVVIEWTTAHVGAGAHGAPHQVDAGLYGAFGSEQPEVFGQWDAPERHTDTWDLAPGPYVLRFTPAQQPRLACVAYDTPFGTTDVPDWCALADDGGDYEVVAQLASITPLDAAPPPPAALPPADLSLALGAAATIAPGRPPPPPSLRIPAVPGQDLVVRWAPPEAELTYHWWAGGRAESSGVCEAHACRFWAPEFDFVELTLGVRDAPEQVTLTASSLPQPAERIALDPGYEVTATIRPVAPGDPRGPIFDFALAAPEPGRYLLGVVYPEGSQQPGIHPLGPGLVDTYLQTVGAEPYEARWYDVAEAGVYPLRVDTCPDCPEVALTVQWMRDEE